MSEEEFFRRAQTDLLGGIDVTRPNSARVWNYLLGGKDNFPADTQAADQYVSAFPGIIDIARHSQMVLARLVRYLALQGVWQFIDVGVGLPSPTGNVHEIAQRIHPAARVLYVDTDPLVLAHAAGLLTSLTPQGRIERLDADIRNPARILAAAAEVMDVAQPVALVCSQVLGHIGDAEARSVLTRLAAGLPGGRIVVVDGVTSLPPQLAHAQTDYNLAAPQPYELRTPHRLAHLLEGLALLEPGLVACCAWRPEVEALTPAPVVEPLAAIARIPSQPVEAR